MSTERIPAIELRVGDSIIDDNDNLVTVEKIYGYGGYFGGQGNLIRLLDTNYNRRYYKATMVVNRVIKIND